MGVMLWLVQNAQRNDTSYNGMEVKRGQICITIKDMAEELGVPYGSIRALLAELEKADLLYFEGVHRGRTSFTLITICDFGNYNGYVNFADDANRSADSNRDSIRNDVRDSRALKNEDKAKKREEWREDGEERKDGKSFSDVIPIEDIKAWILSQRMWVGTFIANHGMTEAELATWIEKFVMNLQGRGTMTKAASDVIKHFNNWFCMRKDTMDVEEQQRLMRKQRERERADEIRRIEREDKERQRREQEEIARRCLAELRMAAANGDPHAIKVMEKYKDVEIPESLIN